MTSQARLFAVLEKCLFTWLADDETVAGCHLRAKFANRLPAILYPAQIVAVLMLHICVVGTTNATRGWLNGDFGQVVPCLTTHFRKSGSVIAVIPAAKYTAIALVKVISFV